MKVFLSLLATNTEIFTLLKAPERAKLFICAQPSPDMMRGTEGWSVTVLALSSVKCLCSRFLM